MAIELQTFASGDTDYIAKLNSNGDEITDAINQLQTQLAAIAGATPASVGMFLEVLFNGADAVIGALSYRPTFSGNTLTVAPGGMYLHAEQTTVASDSNVAISFLAKPAGTYYVKTNLLGYPFVVEEPSDGTIYTIEWTGTAFGAVTQIAPIFYDTREADRSRKSTALGLISSPPESPPILTATTLDERLEAGEAIAVEAKEAVIALEGYVTAARYRKIGCTVDGTTGVKGAIQIDFDGVIIGWSIVADVVGSIQVDVDLKASGPPPTAPSIPNTTTDKISGTAPIQLTAAQSAAKAEAGVATWMTTHVAKWDVIQFNVSSVTTLTRATLYLRIQEILPSPPVITPLEEEVL